VFDDHEEHDVEEMKCIVSPSGRATI
jgi:hypothetical protein